MQRNAADEARLESLRYEALRKRLEVIDLSLRILVPRPEEQPRDFAELKP